MNVEKDECWHLIIVNTPERRAQNLPPVMRVAQTGTSLHPGCRPTITSEPDISLTVVDRLASGGPEWFARRSVQVVAVDTDQMGFEKLLTRGWKHEPDWTGLRAAKEVRTAA